MVLRNWTVMKSSAACTASICNGAGSRTCNSRTPETSQSSDRRAGGDFDGDGRRFIGVPEAELIVAGGEAFDLSKPLATERAAK